MGDAQTLGITEVSQKPLRQAISSSHGSPSGWRASQVPATGGVTYGTAPLQYIDVHSSGVAHVFPAGLRARHVHEVRALGWAFP
jgi:hypothetical protein